MNLLYDMHGGETAVSDAAGRLSPLHGWVSRHGRRSVDQLNRLQRADWRLPLVLKTTTAEQSNGSVVSSASDGSLTAYIDPENELCITDKLSQVL